MWSSLGTLGSIVLSDSELSFLGCFGSTVLGYVDTFVRFVLGVLLSRLPAGLESTNMSDSTVSAVCVFAREGMVGELVHVPGTLILWKEVFLTARSVVWVSCCISS